MSFKRIVSLLCVLLLCASLCVGSFAEAPSEGKEITVLFTHDLHSHLLPSARETGDGEYGGYARLMTAIKEEQEKDPDAILVDGGDFSMGSLFQTAYPTSAIELRMMGEMGYDNSCGCPCCGDGACCSYDHHSPQKKKSSQGLL